jgi:hypothetical protein
MSCDASFISRGLVVKTIVVAILGVCISPPAFAQCSADQQGTVRQQLTAQYAKEEAANKNKDVGAILAMRVGNCTGVDSDGGKTSCADLVNYTKQLMGALGTVMSASDAIQALRTDCRSATATVAQHFVRTQMMAGKMRNVDTSAVQDETWVETPDGWKFQSVANVHARRWYVDGKRVDPHKPFDPDAPPYNPPITADE